MKINYTYLEIQKVFVLMVNGEPFCSRNTLVELVAIVDKIYKVGVVKCFN
jgi:hypothetical protein